MILEVLQLWILYFKFKNDALKYYESLRTKPIKINKYSFDDFNNNYYFITMLFKDEKTEIFDYNLIMFISFLGYIKKKLAL